VAPSRPVTKEGSGSKEIVIVGTFDEFLCPWSCVVLLLLQKQAMAINTSAGIPSPKAMPNLALCKRPVWNKSSKSMLQITYWKWVVNLFLG
jgi:hypothetical protein